MNGTHLPRSHDSLLPLSCAPRGDRIRLVATDVDGTLTQAERFTPDLLAALGELSRAGIATLLVTGRAAGWADALRHYLPVAGAIAENGGVFLPGGSGAIERLGSRLGSLGGPTGAYRRQLAEQFARLQRSFPRLQEATDNAFRLTDWTFAVGDLSAAELDEIATLCREAGWGFTYSTVQGHIKPPTQDKATAIAAVLARMFPALARDRVLTVGDSPNDESMFDRARFPHSVGVANLARYCDRLDCLPTYITTAAESEGFCEIVRHLGSGQERPNASPSH